MRILVVEDDAVAGDGKGDGEGHLLDGLEACTARRGFRAWDGDEDAVAADLGDLEGASAFSGTSGPIAEAKKKGMVGLKGHRSVGGIRVSTYNAVEPAWIDELTAFMQAFAGRG